MDIYVLKIKAFFKRFFSASIQVENMAYDANGKLIGQNWVDVEPPDNVTLTPSFPPYLDIKVRNLTVDGVIDGPGAEDFWQLTPDLMGVELQTGRTPALTTIGRPTVGGGDLIQNGYFNEFNSQKMTIESVAPTTNVFVVTEAITDLPTAQINSNGTTNFRGVFTVGNLIPVTGRSISFIASTGLLLFGDVGNNPIIYQSNWDESANDRRVNLNSRFILTPGSDTVDTFRVQTSAFTNLFTVNALNTRLETTLSADVGQSSARFGTGYFDTIDATTFVGLPENAFNVQQVQQTNLGSTAATSEQQYGIPTAAAAGLTLVEGDSGEWDLPNALFTPTTAGHYVFIVNLGTDGVGSGQDYELTLQTVSPGATFFPIAERTGATESALGRIFTYTFMIDMTPPTTCAFFGKFGTATWRFQTTNTFITVLREESLVTNASGLTSATTTINVGTSAAPTVDQMLIATSGTAATWQDAPTPALTNIQPTIVFMTTSSATTGLNKFVEYDTAITDPEGYMDLVTNVGRYTPAINATYLIAVCVSVSMVGAMGGGQEYVNMSLYKNGIFEQSGIRQTLTAIDQLNMASTWIIQPVGTDFYQIFIDSNDTSWFILGTGVQSTWWSSYKLA